MVDIGTIMQIALPVATVAAAWGGTRQALNGTRERSVRIEDKLDGHITDSGQKHIAVVERLTAVETKISE
jgi:hypothetical protein